MIVIVTGGRSYANVEKLNTVFDELHSKEPISLLIEGGAQGADRLARNWAVNNNVSYLTVHARWNQFGKSAGFIRNQAMIEMRHDIVIAFPGGKGTAGMVKLARNKGSKLMEVM